MYQGYPSRNYWNVSLWIANDEGLYRLALDCIRHARTKDEAARTLHERLTKCDILVTPDGAPFTQASIRYALRGLE